MNFIERLVGVSPDAGSGSLETMLLLLPLLCLAMIWLDRARHLRPGNAFVRSCRAVHRAEPASQTSTKASATNR